MKKYKLQYVALAVAMGLSFSSSALVENINNVTPDDQKRELAYDLKDDIAYLRVKPGTWVELGKNHNEAKIVGWHDVQTLPRINEEEAVLNRKNAQNVKKILIKTVENVKELDRILKNMLDTDNLEAQVKSANQNIQDHKKSIDELKTNQGHMWGLFGAVANNAAKANNNAANVARLDAKTDKMLENDQNLMTGLNNLAAETANGFNRVEAKNQKLEQGVANLEGRVEMTEQGVARLDGQVEMANQNIQDHKKSIDELKTNQGHMWGLFGAVANNAAKANNNAANVARLDAKTDKMLENDQNLMTGLKSLAAETEKGFNRVEAKNQKLEQGVANLDGRVEMTEQGVARLNGRVEMTEQGVAKLDGRVKMTEQGVANLGGRVEKTEKNIATLMPQINRNALDLKNIREDVRSLKKDAKAGIASAVALGMLPQSTVPGKSLMSLGVGHHRGQNAFALGVSTMSENNKWVAKGGMSYDTQKNVSLGGSVGFFFN
ncbi:YadA domain-containing protein [Actinobacillus seminis]|uniref:YadA domain-containing protein n=1 Tax=Actinobacillus seminis TaxID=722 RepID=A0A380VA09_9PAST|nr:YadA-like family protein [Actinobacillus seminis]SUU34865.1 YadA domain-containing protein [Actinobacillus seminis]